MTGVPGALAREPAPLLLTGDFTMTTTDTTQRSISPELLDVNAVAGLLSCSSRHVYRLADAGGMPRPVKLGALVRWPRAAILDWIAAGCPAIRSTGKGGAQ